MKPNGKPKYKYKSVDELIANTTNQALRNKLIARKQQKGLCVVVQNDNIQLALKRFKRKLRDAELMDTIMQKRYYKKPSVKKQEKKRKKRLVIKYANLQKQQQLNKSDK